MTFKVGAMVLFLKSIESSSCWIQLWMEKILSKLGHFFVKTEDL